MLNIKLTLLYALTTLLYNSTPGPVITLVSATSIANSFKRTVMTILGCNLGSFTLMLLAICAMLGLVGINENYLNILKLVGCIYLLYFASKSILSTLKAKKHSEQVIRPMSGGFIQGYSVGVSNPKDIMFFVSFFPQFIGVTHSQSLSLSILGFIWILFDWLILLSYAVLVKKIVYDRFENIFALCASGFILLIAVVGLVDVVHGYL